MDNVKEISISKIADILSKSNIIVPQIDIWKRIFYNAGQSECIIQITLNYSAGRFREAMVKNLRMIQNVMWHYMIYL